MIITLSGTIGSGKTTIASEISRQNFVHISAGGIMRKMAKERNLSLLDFSAYAEKNFEIDKEIDALQKSLVKEEVKRGNNCVVEGRISWFVMKSDIKIFLDADIDVRAKIKNRELSEYKRFKEIYSIDINDLRNYDLCINTSKWDIEGMKKIIFTAIENLKIQI
ncbi:MAG: cytidylate kinase [Candidatus Altiarchaeales archaeon HGW-Altiarchaeales-1]|nr:MAG: cytidylate kinase [Candidatus Altiarchaeales archaeon HGW-Altiarchaeales-1]